MAKQQPESCQHEGTTHSAGTALPLPRKTHQAAGVTAMTDLDTRPPSAAVESTRLNILAAAATATKPPEQNTQ